MHPLICFLYVLLSSAVLLYLYVSQQVPFAVNALCSLGQFFLLLQKELAHLVVVMLHVTQRILRYQHRRTLLLYRLVLHFQRLPVVIT